jgi:hypothetical protein
LTNDGEKRKERKRISQQLIELLREKSEHVEKSLMSFILLRGFMKKRERKAFIHSLEHL